MSSPSFARFVTFVLFISKLLLTRILKGSLASECCVLKICDIGLSMEGDLAGTGNLLGRGGLDVSFPV